MEKTLDQEQVRDRAQGGSRVWAAVQPLVAVGLVVAGQALLVAEPQRLQGGVILLLTGAAWFLWTAAGGAQAYLAADSPAPAATTGLLILDHAWRAALLLSSAILAGAAFTRFGDNRLIGGLLFWLVALLCFLLAAVERSAEPWPVRLRSWWQRQDKRVLLLLAGIILVALFFRYYRLVEVPAEMTSDHTEKLLDVQDVLDGQRPLFFPRNTGREMVQFYTTALLIWLTPLVTNHLALKVGTGLFGLMAVPFTYLLGRELYGRAVGLWSAFFIAVAHWHVAITRVGLRFPFTAAFAAPTLYFLLRALRYNRRNDWLLAATFMGIGLHTYTAMRIVPLLVAVLVGLKLLLDGIRRLRSRPTLGPDPWTRAFWENGLLATLLSALLFLPLLRYWYDNPEGFWYRSLSRAETEGAVSLPLVFLDNVKNALLMFNVRGDVVPINTLPDKPVLGLVSGGLFVLGAAYVLWQLLRHRQRRELLVVVTLFLLLLPSMMSLAFPGENPSVVRTGGAIPIVAVIAALPPVIVLRRLNGLPRPAGGIAVGTVAALFVVTALVYNYHWYFVRYDEHTRRSLWNATEMGAVVRDFVAEGGDLTHAYHLPYPFWVDTRAIGVNAGDPRWNNAVQDLGQLGDHARDPAAKLYLVFPPDGEGLAQLHETYSDHDVYVYDSPWEGKDFVVFRVPAREE